MKIPATLFWSTDRRAFNPGKDKIEGRQAAGASFLEGFIRFSGRKNFYVTSPQINESQQFAATVGSLTDGTGKIVHVPFSAIHKAAEPGLVYRPDPLIGDQAWRWRRFGQRLFSLRGVALAPLAVLTLQGLHAVPYKQPSMLADFFLRLRYGVVPPDENTRRCRSEVLDDHPGTDERCSPRND